MRLIVLLAFFSDLMLLDEAYRFRDEIDMMALLEFKYHVSEEKRVVLSSWNNSNSLCKWNGVTCGRKHKRVTALDLGGLQLGGVISPSIGNLSFLISLNLSDNSFSGIIPQEVGNLFRLKHLDMSFNFLGGGIQVSLSNCSRLQGLDLFSNHLGEGVPSELGSLTKLVFLYLGRNKLEGKLPASLGNLTSLRSLTIARNNMKGEISEDIARLTHMVELNLGVNNFVGVFPPAIYNFSSLEYLYISGNHFSGSLRTDFGKLLPNLQELNMGGNSLTGVIPTTLSNISTLQKLGIDDNNLIGSIPPSFGKLRNLQLLLIQSNSLGSYSVGDLEFMVALTNCTKLETLEIGHNRLGGELPTATANLSTNLYHLDLGKNFIYGSIPYDIGNLISLRSLGLQENMLTGAFPTSLSKLFNLEGLNLMSNKFSGELPSFLGNLTRLDILYLHNNNFEGTIPLSLSNCTSLRELYIKSNKLVGTIPWEIMQIQSLVNLDLSGNFLTGFLPIDVGKLEYLVQLSVGHNKLSGQIPHALGNCLSMEILLMQGNYFDGAIPDIRRLKAVNRVDFSNNNLSGSIPAYLANFSSLEYLNLSVNNLEGSVPTEGIFQNVTTVSVFVNKNLCGGIKELKLNPCFTGGPLMGSKHSSHLKKVAIEVSIGMGLLLLFFIALLSLRWFRKTKKNQQSNNPSTSTLDVFHEHITYGEIRNATDGFSSSNMVGSGSFGTVYKALLPAENKIVAVKVLNMQRRGAMRSFMSECESLKDIKHRNLVKLLTACSSIDFQGNEFRALIYEFMPNGSLDNWLHTEEVEEIHRPSRTLTFLERLNIAIDVASVLDYLHFHCHEPIAHCDLKPSNVLLDDDLTAHVSDFGLSQLLLKFDQESFLSQLSSTDVRGTVGYVAPEYGMGGQPSTHGDVYSFGVLLLEMFTGKRPTSEFFEGNFTLYSYTKLALAERVLDIADKSILHSGLRVGFPIVACLTLVLEVGLRCCEESPANRLATNEAAKELISIRERFFKARRTARR
ncbi:PREDICTED: probable LRR receptor-like serine/threonine-protein kinase At3g47570 [Camelina sativa]|uniref:Probable LRR receptor-like serine/threonine-protein kinase At3g47570 n=1 Tax=Camelina sativa TaxID=90675 RepID=A0ABM1RTB2_CAMSA|nr:PREDICTED: probable LRR receptor-like serine/threonine-protein kinase At3g47570 [Camelina sativa]